MVGHIRAGLLIALAALVAGAAISSNLLAFDIDVGSLKDEIIALEKAKAEAEAEAKGPSIDGGVWHEFESEQGQFSILFPGMPRFKYSVRETAFGDIQENHYELANELGDFSVGFNDLPTVVVVLATDRMIVKRAKRALLEEVGGKEIASEKIEQGGLKGTSVSFQTPKARGAARLFMKKKRLYVLVAMVSKEGSDDGNVAIFMDSFEPFGKARSRKPHKYIDMREPTPQEEEPAATPLPSKE